MHLLNINYSQFKKAVSWLTFSYCNDYLAACSCDLSIKIWSISPFNKGLVSNFTGHRDIINSWRFIAGGSIKDHILATASSDRTLRFWINEKETVTLNWSSSCICMDALVLEWIVVTGHSDGSVRIWSGRQYSLVYVFLNLHTDAVNSLWISPITSTIVSVGKDHSLKLSDYIEKEVLDEIWPDDYINIKHSSESVSWGSYSQNFVIASANDKILMYTLENKKVDKKLDKKEESLAYIPNGRSHSMGSFTNFYSNFNSKKSLKFKQVKVIDTTSKM